MSAFAPTIDALFADPAIASEAIYAPVDGDPIPVRDMSRRANAVTEFGDALLSSETTRLDLRVAEVLNLRPGDRIEIDGEALLFRVSPSATASGSSGP